MNPVELSWRGGTKITLMRRKKGESSTVVNFTRSKELVVFIQLRPTRRRVGFYIQIGRGTDLARSQKNLKLD